MKQAISKPARMVLFIAAIALIGWIDFQTGPDIGFSLFYLIPVIAAGWFEGVGIAVIVAGSASVAWFLAEYFWHPTQMVVTSWNGFTRLAIYMAMGILMAKLHAEREQLRKANAELEAFTVSASHDLRSPLVHIGSYAEMLQRRTGASLDELGRHYLANIADSSRLALGLIDDLLDFSRIGRTEMRRSAVDLSELVEAVRGDLSASAGERSISWVIDPLPVLNADGPMLRVAIQNLLENAVKYTRPRAQARIEVRAETRNDELVVCVRDNGVGFDNQYSGKLFRIFERLHRNGDFEGTGIGLAIVARVIARHGGRTWGEGELDKGAAFYFSLPLRN